MSVILSRPKIDPDYDHESPEECLAEPSLRLRLNSSAGRFENNPEGCPVVEGGVEDSTGTPA